MNITPNSTLYLLSNVPLDPNYNYTLDFDSLANQEQFFDEKISSSFDINEGYSYIRDTQVLKVQANVDSLFGVNYLFYNNGNKRYYAFITKKDYVNSNCTAITFKIDVLQSFMFDYSIDTCYVEREHQDRFNSLGGIRYNTEAENIDIGEHFIKDKAKPIYDNVPEGFEASGNYAGGDVKLFWAYIVTKEAIVTSEDDNQANQPTNNSGLPSNVFYYVAPIAFNPTIMAGNVTFLINSVNNFGTATTAINISQFLELSQDPKVISISLSRYCPFEYEGATQINTTYNDRQYLIIPKIETLSYTILQYKNTGLKDGGLFKINNIKDFSKKFDSKVVEYFIDLSKLSINNKKSQNLEPKLLTEQFCKYQLELGRNKQPLSIAQFISGGFTMLNSFSIRQTQAIMPTNYANNGDFADERNLLGLNYALTIDSSEIEMPLRSDAWLTYLSQNKNSLVSGLKTQALNLALAPITAIAGGEFGVTQALEAVGNTYSAVSSNIAKLKDLKETPDTISKPNLDYIMSYIEGDLFYKEMLYKLPYAIRERVFEYLFAYGYSTKTIKKPNTKSRYYFNFIKTLGANIKSNIDAEVKTEIAQIYDSGLTIWHYRNKNTFKGVNNYDYENVEMTLMEE